jgi:hypothetical protein
MNDEGWAVVTFFLIIALVLIVLFILDRTGLIISGKRADRLCLEAGYAYADNIGGTRVCVGVRGGNTVVEPLDSVRDRLEQD